MAYEWVLGEAVSEGVKRLIGEQIDQALHNLQADDTDRDVAVHEARKCFKRIRAVLRLLRDELGEEIFQQQNAFYRDLARELAPVRDAFVIVETLDTIITGLDDADLKHVAQTIRQDLQEELEQAQHNFWQKTNTVTKVITALEDAKHQLEDLPITHDSFKAFKHGLKRVYKRGQKRMTVAYARIPESEPFHDWRKRVKYLWYHMTIIQPIYPAEVMPLVTQLDELSDLLGLAHDYAVLRGHITAHPLAAAGTGRQLLAHIDFKRGELEASCQPFGDAIYAQKPKQFTAQVKHWWENPKPILA